MRMKSNGNVAGRMDSKIVAMDSRRKVTDMREEGREQAWKWIGIFAGVMLLILVGGYFAVPAIRQAEIVVWRLFMRQSIGDKVDCILIVVCAFAFLISVNRTLRKARLNRGK